MSLLGRSMHGQLTNMNKNLSKSAKDGAQLDTTEFKAANELICDGIDFPMQGQMVLRNRGVALKSHVKADLGKLITPDLLKLEIGANISASAMGKRTILVMRGPDLLHGSSVKNELPIIIACLEGWRFTGGAGLEATVGVGGTYGGAAFSSDTSDGFKGKTQYITKPSSYEPDPVVSSTVVEAKAEFFAGLKSELAG